MKLALYDWQLDAVKKMKNGCLLCGDVGSGKSLTSLAYYYIRTGGDWNTISGGAKYVKMKNPKDLYIITTARKRDTFEWCKELAAFLMSPEEKASAYKNKVIIDSWNNIAKYVDVKDAFFIFDEQRVVGYGTWSKSFIKISKHNEWILLSATPGDCWMDYIPVFIANGFYKDKSEFIHEHIVYKNFRNFPQIDRYLNVGRLIRLRKSILVDMDFNRPTVPHHEDVYAIYDKTLYKQICRDRWNIWEDEPIKNASEFCYSLRKIVNSDQSRTVAILEIYEKHPKMIIFYNFDYELEILKNIYYGNDVVIAEWNGHKHQPIPETDKWVYLVQYNAGAEGWNCIRTDTIVFYSQNYSYKMLEQACGRIDRLNTPFKDLYYYHIKSRSGIDLAISKALSEKKKFNESRYVKKFNKE